MRTSRQRRPIQPKQSSILGPPLKFPVGNTAAYANCEIQLRRIAVVWLTIERRYRHAGGAHRSPEWKGARPKHLRRECRRRPRRCVYRSDAQGLGRTRITDFQSHVLVRDVPCPPSRQDQLSKAPKLDCDKFKKKALRSAVEAG